MDSKSVAKEESPIISIVIPTYNRAGLIRETLDSIKAQTSPHWEAIVVDDGSSDDTESVVAEYSKSDNRFSFYQRDREPKGAPTCRNIGLQHAKGDWVIFLDSDDLLTENCCLLVKQNLEHSNGNNDALVCRTNKFVVSPKNYQECFQPDLVDDDLGAFIVGNIIWQTSGAVWNSQFIRNIGGFREGLSRGQDWDLAVRALLHFPKIKKISDVISLHRVSTRNDRITNLPLDIHAHEELFYLCLEFIDLAKSINQNKKIIRHIIAGAFYRLAFMAWNGNFKKSKKLLFQLNAKRRINIFLYYNLKIKLIIISILSKINNKSKNIAKTIASPDGIRRSFP
jgi:glycosyltransferase involved in cell wall biosynthesis